MARRATGPTSSACRRSRRSPSRSRRCSSNPRATGATGTARAATPASRCTCARTCAPSGRRSRTPSSIMRRASSRPTSAGVTVASVYVPNGGKDYPAKLRFLEALEGYARERRGGRARAPDLRRSQRRAHRPRRAPQGAQGRRDRPAAGRARALREDDGARPRGRRPHARSRQRRASSPGGRPGATCGSATSAGGSTTSWRANRWPRARSRASCVRRSARATMRRSSRISTRWRLR